MPYISLYFIPFQLDNSCEKFIYFYLILILFGKLYIATLLFLKKRGVCKFRLLLANFSGRGVQIFAISQSITSRQNLEFLEIFLQISFHY